MRPGPLVLLLCLLSPAIARADACAIDAWDNGTIQGGVVFPNWLSVPVGDIGVFLCEAGTCSPSSPENIKGLTVVNFGTAAVADIAAVVWKASCGATTTGLVTMTYAGMYSVDAGTLPAWTWAGSSVDFSACADLCGSPPCGGAFNLELYVNVAACPTPGTTIRMGLPTNFSLDPAHWGALTDGSPLVCSVPNYDIAPAEEKTILWSYKTGPTTAAPGDTVAYTIYYGRPGTAPVTVQVMDTQPPYTHYIQGSGVPAPDAGYDPDWGPPARIQWSNLGPLATTGGPTGEIRFSMTVDWGNGEVFEPGSGDTAAPEGSRLDNRAQVFFGGTTCATKSSVNPPVTTVVRRFLFWKVGDNDILFSPSLGQPPDEMVYSIFIKNMSTTKTWWDVHLWDTVPVELDPWCANCGVEDPCTGWTMTPSGCAAAYPGVVTGAGRTMITWRMDMPPAYTIEMRWKAQVRPTVTAGATAAGTASLLAYGRTNIMGGTGHSGKPRTFTHLAQIVLPTTYVSYVAYAASDDDKACPGFYITFFPLNKKSQFELRGLEYEGAGWATTGGPSASIGCLIGDCIGGFPGNGGACLTAGLAGGGIAGCKAERIPARYDPPWAGVCPVYPADFIYKVVSNSPVLWQLLTHIDGSCEDRHLYTPSTSLSYAGFMHYAWRNEWAADDVTMINTSVNAQGVFDPTLQTTTHLFQFDYATNAWSYRSTYEIDAESLAADFNSGAPDDGPWRIMSSDARLINHNGALALSNQACCCVCCGDNQAAYMPSRETGAGVSPVGGGNLYGIANGRDLGNLNDWRMTIGNTSGGGAGPAAALATYHLWKYTPNNQLAPPATMPTLLRDTGGFWELIDTDTVTAGMGTAGNPDVYDNNIALAKTGASTLFKVEVVSGGPVQVLHGVDPYSPWAGGAVIHASNGNQTGVEFWLHFNGGQENASPVVNFFFPKTGMAMRAESSGGYSASYTTTGPDQAILFQAISGFGGGSSFTNRRNWKFTVLPNPAQGNVMGQFIMTKVTEKGYTAPFLTTGTHYRFIAPAVVFSGQAFWLTIVVEAQGGGTQTDYCGTTSFSSTDPAAKIEGTPMQSYDFTWSSSVTPCNNNGAAPDENGVRLFVNVTLNKLGIVTIVGIDTADGSISGLTAINVVAADIKLSKSPRLAISATSDTVQFRVCWSNYSSASGFTFVIIDAIPLGTTFVPEAGTAAFDCGNTRGEVPRTAYSQTAQATPPAAFTEANPVNLPSTVKWLRWTIPVVGVNTTGCICYRVSVN